MDGRMHYVDYFRNSTRPWVRSRVRWSTSSRQGDRSSRRDRSTSLINSMHNWMPSSSNTTNLALRWVGRQAGLYWWKLRVMMPTLSSLVTVVVVIMATSIKNVNPEPCSVFAIMPSHQQYMHVFTDGWKNIDDIFNKPVSSVSCTV